MNSRLKGNKALIFTEHTCEDSLTMGFFPCVLQDYFCCFPHVYVCHICGGSCVCGDIRGQPLLRSSRPSCLSPRTRSFSCVGGQLSPSICLSGLLHACYSAFLWLFVSYDLQGSRLRPWDLWMEASPSSLLVLNCVACKVWVSDLEAPGDLEKTPNWGQHLSAPWILWLMVGSGQNSGFTAY